MIRWISCGPGGRIAVEVEQHQLVQRFAAEHHHRFDVPGSHLHRLLHRRRGRRPTAAERKDCGALEQGAVTPPGRGLEGGQHLGSSQGLVGGTQVAAVEVVAGAALMPGKRQVRAAGPLAKADDLFGRDDAGCERRPEWSGTGSGRVAIARSGRNHRWTWPPRPLPGPRSGHARSRRHLLHQRSPGGKAGWPGDGVPRQGDSPVHPPTDAFVAGRARRRWRTGWRRPRPLPR